MAPPMIAYEVQVTAKGTGLLMDHEAVYAQHDNTAVVELDGTFGELGVLINGVLAEENVAVAEVVYKLVAGSFGIAPEM